MASHISVEVAAGNSHRQVLLEVRLDSGATVADAVAAAMLEKRLPEIDSANLTVSVWGTLCDRSRVLQDGDRVELLRELLLDPREARRQLALHGGTMRAVKGPDEAPGRAESR